MGFDSEDRVSSVWELSKSQKLLDEEETEDKEGFMPGGRPLLVGIGMGVERS
jgi:hypothetical protein